MKPEILNNVIKFYKTLNFCKDTKPEQLAQAGSDRLYFRFKNKDNSIVVAYNPNIPENISFLYFSEILKNAGVNVPEVYSHSKDFTMYALQDLGDNNLLQVLLNNRNGDEIPDFLIDFYKSALSQLAKMQICADKITDYKNCFSIKEFNTTSILFDLNYFKYYFLNLNKIIYDELKLQQDFEAFANELDEFGHKYFMFRDFQARNIMIFDKKTYFIDYQGARKGCLCYDPASLLYQAKANLPNIIRQNLMDYYIIELQKYIKINPERFTEVTLDFVFLRILQTLGAYGNRGIIERKPHFLESIPNAVENMMEFLENCHIEHRYPEFYKTCRQIEILL